MRRRTTGLLAALAIVAAACSGGASDDSSADPAGTPVPSDTTAPGNGDPDTAPPITLGERSSPLDDRSTITQKDTGRLFSTTIGNRIQLQLSSDWLWSQPVINPPHQLIEINYVQDPGFSAWDILIAEPGYVLIEATGVGLCDDCGDREFTVTITAPNE